MGSDIVLKDQFFGVSNRRFNTLVLFALDVSEALANTDERREWRAKLDRFYDESWPGIIFDLDEQFPTVPEKKFWARVYRDVAQRIFLREIGIHDRLTWQSSAIGDAYIISRMLTRAVQLQELGWHPEDDDEGRINVGF